MGDVLTLRPHHLLCLRFFAGHGYSPAFVERMTAIQAAASGNRLIELVAGGDLVCEYCPHFAEVCDSDEKSTAYDQAVLSACGLELNTRYRWSELSALIADRIFANDCFSEICPDCEWAEFCHTYS